MTKPEPPSPQRRAHRGASFKVWAVTSLAKTATGHSADAVKPKRGNGCPVCSGIKDPVDADRINGSGAALKIAPIQQQQRE